MAPLSGRASRVGISAGRGALPLPEENEEEEEGRGKSITGGR